MIPRDYITEWRVEAPWVQDVQVEQDLVVSRALVEIFSHPVVRDALAFRGGTALFKLYLRPAARYSEDIDLVQRRAEPAGPVMDALHEVLDPWLGKPRWKQSDGRVTLAYRFQSEDATPIAARLKVEINTREHFVVGGFQNVPFEVSSRWFDGACDIPTYDLHELLGTKLRALYQRKKGRDLFDLDIAFKTTEPNRGKIVDIFRRYMEHGGHDVTRAQFEQNLADKLADAQFTADISSLLATDVSWDIRKAAAIIQSELIERL